MVVVIGGMAYVTSKGNRNRVAQDVSAGEYLAGELSKRNLEEVDMRKAGKIKKVNNLQKQEIEIEEVSEEWVECKKYQVIMDFHKESDKFK